MKIWWLDLYEIYKDNPKKKKIEKNKLGKILMIKRKSTANVRPKLFGQETILKNYSIKINSKKIFLGIIPQKLFDTIIFNFSNNS